MVSKDGSLLSPDDPPPVRVTNPAGGSLFLLVGDHAGGRIPGRLGRLGLSDADLARHIAIDLGVSALGRALAGLLDAVFIEQRYSRLVIDCNRSEAASDSIARLSDGTVVPGNLKLDASDRQARHAEIFVPYHSAIAREIETRLAIGRPTVLIALHSFTPLLGAARRPWDIGILHDGGDASFAAKLLAQLVTSSLCIGDNEPYRMDETDFTVPFHAYGRSLPYAEIEVRQDLLQDGPAVGPLTVLLAEALWRAALPGSAGDGSS